MRKLFLVLSFLFASFKLHADELNQTVGIIYGGGMSYSESSTYGSSSIIAAGIYYDYQIDPRFSVKVVHQVGGEFCMITCQENPYVGFRSTQLSVMARQPISKRWNVFGRLGVNAYNLNYPNGIDNNNLDPKLEISGSGLVAAIGTEAKFGKRFKLGFEFQHLPMKTISIRTLSVMAGFSF